MNRESRLLPTPTSPCNNKETEVEQTRTSLCLRSCIGSDLPKSTHSGGTSLRSRLLHTWFTSTISALPFSNSAANAVSTWRSGLQTYAFCLHIFIPAPTYQASSPCAS